MKNQKIPFKAKVKDTLTGHTGYVTGYLLYMTGCVQYYIESIKDNEPKGCWVDEQRLEVLETEKAEKPKKGPDFSGGPARGPRVSAGPPGIASSNSAPTAG